MNSNKQQSEIESQSTFDIVHTQRNYHQSSQQKTLSPLERAFTYISLEKKDISVIIMYGILIGVVSLVTLLTINALVTTISAEIDDATSELIASYQQYITAKQENSAAIQMENAERQLLSQGESSLFTVNLRERFSAESAGRVVDALIQYHKAFSLYQWSIAGF